MCGIFATTCPELWRNRIPEVLRLLQHRGPDAEGVWESPDGEVLLAHTRLAIIGLGSEGDQPATLCSQHGLTFNGEIYNYRELAVGLRWRRGDLGHPNAASAPDATGAAAGERLSARGPAAGASTALPTRP